MRKPNLNRIESVFQQLVSLIHVETMHNVERAGLNFSFPRILLYLGSDDEIEGEEEKEVRGPVSRDQRNGLT